MTTETKSLPGNAQRRDDGDTQPMVMDFQVDPGYTTLIVFCFLWIAFIAVSIVAFWAIVFTGKYPRGLFDYSSGVLRWTWRVCFYSYEALGTDKYPAVFSRIRPGISRRPRDKIS